ncbi:hypothetical protein NGRA_1950 [Nosema granulosis]|uniref:Uncharacterized protein n=1 Tax=Nosema granulosis TaxID=83296 RepID=A0A9P6GXX1_9MICR|nr:hypothetical protein NGRA_1950 [Nosema granulosis]
MLSLFSYFKCFLAYEELIQEYNFPVKVYKSEMPHIDLSQEIYNIYIFKPLPTGFNIIQIPVEDLTIIEDSCKTNNDNYSEATLIVGRNSVLKKEFKPGNLIRMGIVNHTKDLLITDFIYVKKDGTIESLTYTRHIELFIYAGYLLTYQDLPQLKLLYCCGVNFQNIIRAIYSISIQTDTKRLKKWKRFLNGLEWFEYTSDGWKRYKDIIEKCFQFLSANHPLFYKYITETRKYTSDNDFKDYVIRKIAF